MDMSPYVNVVDVYEAASDIGRDLEQLAEKFGQESIEKLVPKICIVLEQLEQSVGRSEKDGLYRAELQTAVEQMELARQERKQARLRHEAELTQMEMEWHQEVSQLTVAMDTLISENEKLRQSMASRRPSQADVAPSQGGQTDGGEDGLLALTTSMSAASVSSLKDVIAKSKEEIRGKTHELEETQGMLANANAETEKQAAAIQVHKKRNRNLQNQARKLMEEKNQLTIQLRECMLQTISLEHDIKGLQPTIAAPNVSQASARLLPMAAEKSSASGSDCQDESADSPRFTMNELRALINERNELKGKVMELHDELTAMKTTLKIRSSPSVDKGIDTMEESDLDAPVQGPINREPDEKLQSPSSRPRQRESTIRNLFRGLFGETSGSGSGIFYNLKESSAHLGD